MYWLLWTLAIGSLASWVLPALAALISRWDFRKLAGWPEPEGPLPRVSIVVAALNEADTIEPAMRSLLALDYPDLELIAIDDRSTDATGAILDRLGTDNPRLRVAHIADLPAGWLGKNHALHIGSSQSTGKYILFTDADVVFEPTALRRAVRVAEAESLDQLAVLPSLAKGGFWETLTVSFFGIIFFLYTTPWKVRNPRSKAHIGVGAFNLVLAETYRKAGGHASLPMDVADDVKLGKRMKMSGGRCDFLDGAGLLSVRWVVGLRGIVHGLTKNMFAGFSYNPVSAVAGMIGMLIMATWPAVGLFVGPLGPRIICGCALAMMVYASWRGRPSPGASALYGLGYPIAGVIFAYIVLRSMTLTYWRGGVIWRGTLYPLRELRKGVV